MATEDDCLEALRAAAERLGESPTKAQYEELGLTPASATIIRTCGGWNDAKEKAGLEISYSRGSRVGPKPDDVELPEGTSWGELSVDQRWHYKNADWNTERSLERRESHRAWANELQRARGGCDRCSEMNPVCLDFHHVNEDEKEMAVGKMIAFGYAKDRIRNEIEKCIVLCANCHRKEHYDPLSP
ncbi:homing endonuclease associated repeat-containing protein [Natrinema amylolyticum]|uniref:homing endonuclease associated repeat-containing protein n=1 Tax=Natrinema amylolyticum TaxID=2878679 RepID=UPI001CFACA31